VSGDTITILRARRRLAKLWKADGTSEGYEDAKHYDMHSAPVESLDALHRILVELLHRPDCGVVRGAILDPARTQAVRRLVHPDPETGDQPTLQDAAHHWLALDVDGVPLPAEVNPLDLAACARAVLPMLPEPVRDAELIVQATGSHAMKPGARLRLWGWCDRALTGSELKRWFSSAPVDASLFRPAQINYTAAPVFAEGATDPLPERLVRLPGTVPLIQAPSATTLTPPPKQQEPAPRLNAASGSRYALAALTRACSNISRQGEGSRHPTAVSEALGLARLVNAGLLTQAEVTRAVDGALRQAGKPTGEGTAIVAWALSRRTDTGNLPAGVRA
jgi:hypothetical protein